MGGRVEGEGLGAEAGGGASFSSGGVEFFCGCEGRFRAGFAEGGRGGGWIGGGSRGQGRRRFFDGSKSFLGEDFLSRWLWVLHG